MNAVILFMNFMLVAWHMHQAILWKTMILCEEIMHQNIYEKPWLYLLRFANSNSRGSTVGTGLWQVKDKLMYFMHFKKKKNAFHAQIRFLFMFMFMLSTYITMSMHVSQEALC